MCFRSLASTHRAKRGSAPRAPSPALEREAEARCASFPSFPSLLRFRPVGLLLKFDVAALTDGGVKRIIDPSYHTSLAAEG